MSKQQKQSPIHSLLNQKIKNFVNSFRDGSRQLFADSDGNLVHPGEFGAYREAVTKDFLKAFVPQRMGIDSGFLINPSGKISTQCDLVIYDKSSTPLLENENLQRFFPAESVCAVGEVKSKMSVSELKVALRKLAAVKSMRDAMWNPVYQYCIKEDGLISQFKPEIDERDQILTFIICESFSFDFHKNASEILSCYIAELPEYPKCLRHNMILSIDDGLVTYFFSKENVLYPFSTKITFVSDCEYSGEVKKAYESAMPMIDRFVKPKKGSVEHIRHFSKMLHQALCITSVLFPDMSKYVESNEVVNYFDYKN